MDAQTGSDVRARSVLRISSEGAPPPSLAGGRVLPQTIRLELFEGSELLGCWTLTPDDLGLQSKELFTKVADRFPRVTRVIDRSLSFVDWFGDVRVDSWRRWLPFTILPLRTTTGMKRALAAAADPGAELWLEFADPSGLLPLVGWERILRLVTDRPVLRLPYSKVTSIIDTSHLEIAFCCTAPSVESRPSAKDLREIAEKIATATGAAAHREVHVFADRFYYEELKKQVPKNLPIHIYDPCDQPTAPDEPYVHPWRKWMTKELRGRAVDIIHTVAPTRFAGRDEAFLVVARMPAVPEATRKHPVPVRYISPYEHAQFCTQFGAWAIVFTAFGSADDRTATAAVADGVARCRPGIVALHDSVTDLFLSGVEELYRFLSEGAKRAPKSDAVSVYCNPQTLSTAEKELDPFWQDILSASVPSDPTQETPEWLAATHRLLESSAMQYLEGVRYGEEDKEAREGAKDALRFVSVALSNLGKQRDVV